MSSTTTAPPAFGREVGETAQALRDLLADRLTPSATSFESWVVLSLLSSEGPTDRGAFRNDLAGRLRIDAAAAAGLLDQAERQGLVQSVAGPADERGPRIGLSSEGEARYLMLRQTVGQATAELLAGIDPADVTITLRTMRSVAERAQAILAG